MVRREHHLHTYSLLSPFDAALKETASALSWRDQSLETARQRHVLLLRQVTNQPGIRII